MLKPRNRSRPTSPSAHPAHSPQDGRQSVICPDTRPTAAADSGKTTAASPTKKCRCHVRLKTRCVSPSDPQAQSR
jgi:hypothetical protein